MRHKLKLAAAVSILALASTPAALAQTAATAETDTNAETETSEDDVLYSDVIVVTGTATGRSLLDAPFAISSFSEAEIERAAPLNFADLLKTTPGFSAEPSGGQGGGQNLYVRGLPDGGWFNVQLQEDGLTLFDEPQESFLNIDTLFALDLMTERVEVVRGGTSPIFANNAPGGTVNVITRRGTQTPEGAVRLTYGSNNQVRADAYSAGPISDSIRYSVGGFYNVDDGLRDPGFTANEGGQIRGNLTFDISDNLTLDVDARYLNNRTAFYSPIPLADPRNPSASLSSLIDPQDGTVLSNDFRFTAQRSFFGSEATVSEADLADGIHTEAFSTGAYLTWEGDNGVTITNKTRLLDADVGYNAIFSAGLPQDASRYLAGALSRAQNSTTGFGPSVTSTGFALAGTRTAFNPASSAGLVLENGLWTTDVSVATINNDFRVSKEFNDGIVDVLSAGLYYSRFSFEADWLFNTILTSVENQPRLLDVVAFNASGAEVGRVTENGFTRYGNTVVSGISDGTYVSPYASAAFELGKLGFDLGLRYTFADSDGGFYPTAQRNLGDPNTLADNNVGGLLADFNATRDSQEMLNWTAGAEYDVSSEINVFARYTDGERLPRLGNVYRGQNADKQTSRQAEGGVRLALPDLDLGLIGFWSQFDNYNQNAIVLDSVSGNIVTIPLSGETRTVGAEAELRWRPIDLLGVVASATVQTPESVGLERRDTGESFENAEGLQLPRIPKVIFSVAPTLYFDIADRPVEVSAELYHIGERFVDFSNTTALPAYTTIDLNFKADLTNNISLRTQISNLTDEFGLTEGNPRSDTFIGQGTSEAIYGRPIFGRSFQVALTYAW